jgi:hypothetical protein
LRIAVSAMGLEPGGSAEWAVAGKIRNGRQIAALKVCGLNEARIVLDELTRLRPSAREVSSLRLP